MKFPQNIDSLIKLKPDFVGFIFYKKSSRYVGKKIPETDYGNTNKTGVFVDENINDLLQISKYNNLDFVQLHGNESIEYCKIVKNNGFKIIKVFSIDNNFDFNVCKDYANVSDLFLFDTKGKLPGGNGIRFDWKQLKEYKLKTKFLLSGGIGLKDLKSIKEFSHSACIGIDVNSGFEVKPGLKNIQELNLFFNELK